MEENYRHKDCLCVYEAWNFQKEGVWRKIVSYLDFRQNSSQYLMRSACNM
jgi:hypothetical protein